MTRLTTQRTASESCSVSSCERWRSRLETCVPFVLGWASKVGCGLAPMRCQSNPAYWRLADWSARESKLLCVIQMRCSTCYPRRSKLHRWRECRSMQSGSGLNAQALSLTSCLPKQHEKRRSRPLREHGDCTESDVDLTGTLTPLELLYRFLEAYGVPVIVGTNPMATLLTLYTEARASADGNTPLLALASVPSASPMVRKS